MRLAVLSDIHANWPALEAVAQDLEDVKPDLIYCLGDIIGYGPFPVECVKWVRQNVNIAISGNAEAALFDPELLNKFNSSAMLTVEESRKLLNRQDLCYLRDLPRKLTISLLNVSIAHACFDDQNHWRYIDEPELAQSEMIHFSTPIGLVGHSHQPGIWDQDGLVFEMAFPFCPLELRYDRQRVINVGSVGFPRDYDPRACYVVLDLRKNEYIVDIRRVCYDLTSTIMEMEDWPLADELAKRLWQGR